MKLVTISSYPLLDYFYPSVGSLVPRPPCPAFVTCNTKSAMHAAADVTFSLLMLTSGFVLSPSLIFP